MHLVAVGLVLVSAMLHAFRDYLTKRSDDKPLFVWWYRLTGLVLFLPIFLWRWGQPIPSSGWIYILMSGIIHAAYWHTLAEAYQEGDLSLVYPIARSAPLFVLVWAALIWHDPMTPAGITGIVVVVLGAYVLQMKRNGTASGTVGLSWRHLAAPVLATAHDRSTRLAWVTALLVAGYSLIDDRGVEFVDPLIYLYTFTVIGTLTYVPHMVRTRRGRLLAEWRAHRGLIVLTSAIGLTGYLLALMALRIERVGYVTAVRQLSIVFGVMYGNVLLHESHGRIRMLAAGIMFVGMALIVTLG